MLSLVSDLGIAVWYVVTLGRDNVIPIASSSDVYTLVRYTNWSFSLQVD